METLWNKNATFVTDIAGTTRDSINTRYQKFDFDFILTDTAGLRRKTKVQQLQLGFAEKVVSVKS